MIYSCLRSFAIKRWTRLILYMLVSLSLLAFVYLSDNISDKLFSFLYIAVLLLSIISIWFYSHNKIGIFIMFMLSFSVFIGGRFIANVLGYEGDVFSPTSFYDYSVGYLRKRDLFLYVIAFVVFSTLGYCLYICRMIKPMIVLSSSAIFSLKIRRVSSLLFPLFCILILKHAYSTLVVALSGGYLSLFMDQVEEYSPGGKFMDVIIYFFLSISIVFGDVSLKKKYLVLFFVNSLVDLFIGTRTAMASLFLFLIWIYSLEHKVNIKKLIVYSFLSLIILLYLFSYSIRVEEFDLSSYSFTDVFDTVVFFFYQNGVSLMVFDASRLIDSYPAIAYFQTFIPGATWFWGLFGNSMLPQDISFSYHLCHELNPSLFNEGFGLGWTVLSDLYLLSCQGNPILFVILSLLVGVMLALLDNLSAKYSFYLFISVFIFMKCMILPRSSLAAVIPLFCYGYVLYFVMKQLLNRRICKSLFSNKKLL